MAGALENMPVGDEDEDPEVELPEEEDLEDEHPDDEDPGGA